jgi:hypothetical protein
MNPAAASTTMPMLTAASRMMAFEIERPIMCTVRAPWSFRAWRRDSGLRRQA